LPRNNQHRIADPVTEKNSGEIVNAESPQAAPPPAERLPRRQGAQDGNANAMRSGLKASKLPPKCKGEERELYTLRQEVLDELIAEHGSAEAVPLLPLALLQSMIRHETRARLAARWLRLEEKNLTIEQKLLLLKEISAATDSRDKCMERAGLTAAKCSRSPDSEPRPGSLDAIPLSDLQVLPARPPEPPAAPPAPPPPRHPPHHPPPAADA
jgi:hypothetical protein